MVERKRSCTPLAGESEGRLNTDFSTLAVDPYDDEDAKDGCVSTPMDPIIGPMAPTSAHEQAQCTSLCSGQRCHNHVERSWYRARDRVNLGGVPW